MSFSYQAHCLGICVTRMARRGKAAALTLRAVGAK